MKRIYFLILGAGLTLGAYAQDGNNICAWNAMNTFDNGGGPADLEAGLKCSDDASVHEVTSVKSKTWFYRGQLYTKVFQEKTLKAKYPNAGVEAASAFIKLNDLKDPKFKDWEDANRYIGAISIDLYNQGAEYYDAKNYAQAAKLWTFTRNLNSVLEMHKGTQVFKTCDLLTNIAQALDAANDNAAATSSMEEAYKLCPDSVKYLPNLIYLNKKSGNKERAMELVDLGLSKQPTNAALLSEKINVFLSKGDVLGGLAFVNNLILVDPKNDQAYVIKGLAYDSLSRSESLLAANKLTKDAAIDSMVTSYKKSIEINPGNATANNNLGKIFIDKANALITKSNSLGNSAADTKLYDELQVKIKKHYEDGFPYLEKAYQLDPNNQDIKRSYNQVKIKLGK